MDFIVFSANCFRVIRRRWGLRPWAPPLTRATSHLSAFYLKAPHKNMLEKGLCLLKKWFKNTFAIFSLPLSAPPVTN